MNRLMVVFAVAACVLNGCKSTSCRKASSCQTCVTPAPVFAAPPPSTMPPQEILFGRPNSAPLDLPPPPSSPAPPPAPTFPTETPRASGFAAPPADNPSRIAGATPEILIEKPEFSETSRRDVTALKATSVGLAANAGSIRVAVPGQYLTGPRPTLDDLDRLYRAGVRKLAVVDGKAGDTDQTVFASRGFSLVPATTAPTDGPVYVFATDETRLKAWWTNYFRGVEYLSADAAEIRVNSLFR
jgi:hypothetical protein